MPRTSVNGTELYYEIGDDGGCPQEPAEPARRTVPAGEGRATHQTRPSPSRSTAGSDVDRSSAA